MNPNWLDVTDLMNLLQEVRDEAVEKRQDREQDIEKTDSETQKSWYQKEASKHGLRIARIDRLMRVFGEKEI